MIKAIFFDVGGVYMSGSSVDFINRSYKILGIDKNITTSDGVVFDADFNKGLISYKDCFQKFFAVPISEEQMQKIKDVWMSTWRPTVEMLELVKGLKKNYTLAILSNSDLLNSSLYTQEGLYSYFDYLILSHELGITKPDERIYKIALEKINLPAEQCLFIDDQESVLVPAQKFGMETILFKSIDQLKEELKNKGVQIISIK